MDGLLTPEQLENRARFRNFASTHFAPVAGAKDAEGVFSPELQRDIANGGYLGSLLPVSEGGRGFDPISYGLLHQEFGRVWMSAKCMLTVHDMVVLAISRFGTRKQTNHWLPKLTTGDVLAAFALTELHVGSDARAIQTEARRCGSHYVLSGSKLWVTFAQRADVVLVFAHVERQPTAFLVTRDNPGLIVRPMAPGLGLRAAMLAEIELLECIVPDDCVLGPVGGGVSMVSATALDLGRYTIAWGAVGLAQACLDASIHHSATRFQFGVHLSEHQLVRGMVADMRVGVHAARALCHQAGLLRQLGDPSAITATCIAKYFAAAASMRAAADAVQIHGAAGCAAGASVQRYLCDAKVLEIIEGTNQLHQLIISNDSYQQHEAAAFRASAHG